MKRIPSLDGLRAVSIMLVLVGHLFNRMEMRENHPVLATIFGNSALGVTVFFVISGYLITLILLEEFDCSGSICIRRFYFRRMMRIFPAYYLYLSVVVLLSVCSVVVVSWKDIVVAASYFVNYSSEKNWILSHAWSLSVEEQFYLLWPTILLTALVKGGRNAAIVIAAAIIILSPLARYISYSFGSNQLYYMFHTRIDSIMMGCFMALVSGSNLFERFINIVGKYWLGFALFVVVISPLLTNRYGGKYIYIIGMSLECVSLGIIVVWLARNPRTIVGCLLNSKIVVKVGVMSYSIYIWQQILLHENNKTVSGMFPCNVLTVLLVSWMSYAFIEKYFLSLRVDIEKKYRFGLSNGVVGR